MSISKPNYYKIVANMMIKQYGLERAIVVTKDIICELIDSNEDYIQMCFVHRELTNSRGLNG